MNLSILGLVKYIFFLCMLCVAQNINRSFLLMLYEEKFTENCPQCGDALAIHFKYTKLIKCHSCKSTIFLEDDSVKLIGKSAVLSPEPSLIKLHKTFKFQNRRFTPLGKIRYSYGRGFWEEWFLQDENGKPFWLSIDEGDFVLEEKINFSLPFKKNREFKVGQYLNDYQITEIGEGVCVGFEGELPEAIKLNETHQYVHLSRGNGELLTLEFAENETMTFKGQWIDPLAIEVL